MYIVMVLYVMLTHQLCNLNVEGMGLNYVASMEGPKWPVEFEHVLNCVKVKTHTNNTVSLLHCSVCTRVDVYVYLYICLYVCTCVCACVCTCVCVVCTCTCVCIYVWSFAKNFAPYSRTFTNGS